jgi:uncharacterized membrane protein YkoI
MTPIRKATIGAFLLGSAVAGGISMTTLGSASAASNTTATVAAAAPAAATDPATAADPAPATPAVPAGPHQANGITETILTGDEATKVQAAVLAAQPGATIDRMETDADGAVYEAHITLADGSDATVKLDANYTVTATETGHR